MFVRFAILYYIRLKRQKRRGTLTSSLRSAKARIPGWYFYYNAIPPQLFDTGPFIAKDVQLLYIHRLEI